MDSDIDGNDLDWLAGTAAIGIDGAPTGPLWALTYGGSTPGLGETPGDDVDVATDEAGVLSAGANDDSDDGEQHGQYARAGGARTGRRVDTLPMSTHRRALGVLITSISLVTLLGAARSAVITSRTRAGVEGRQRRQGLRPSRRR
jgi:hypothetical protein